MRVTTPLRAVFKGPDPKLALGFFHIVHHGHRRQPAAKSKVAALECADFARAQAEHSAHEHPESESLRHGVRHSIQHRHRQRRQVAFPGGLSVRGGLHSHRVDVDQFIFDRGVHDGPQEVVGLPAR